MITEKYKEQIKAQKEKIQFQISKATEIVYDLVLDDLEQEDPGLTSFPCKLELKWGSTYYQEYRVFIKCVDHCLWQSDDGFEKLTFENIKNYRDTFLQESDYFECRKEFLDSGV